MMRRAAVISVTFGVLVACSAGDDLVSRDPGTSRTISDPGDVAEPAPATDVTVSVSAPTTTEPGIAPASGASTGVVVEAPTDAGPGVFVDDGALELAVSVFSSPIVGDGAQPPAVGLAVEMANADLVSPGSPFEPGGLFSAPILVEPDVELVPDSAILADRLDELLIAEADLFIGQVPVELVADATELAASRELALVVVNHIAGAGDQLATRLDLGGSIDLELRAVVSAVVTGEHDGIVLVGSPNDPNTEQMRQLLLGVGADPVVVDAAEPPSAAALEAARVQIASVGERPAVVLVSEPWAAPLIDALVAAGSEAQFFGSDVSLDEGGVAALAAFGPNQLVVVRRIDDQRRAEVQDFASRLDVADGVTAPHASVSYDAYALAAIAAVSIGSADGATIRRAMIDASRLGEPCDLLADCIALAASGADVDYEGISGPLDLDDDGVATAAWFSLDVVDPDTRSAGSSEFVLQRHR